MSTTLVWKRAIWVTLIAFCTGVSGSFAANDPKITNQSVDEMAQTYGFVQGQQASLNALALKFPEHAQTFATAKVKFELAFESALTNIDRLLTEKNTTWITTKASIDKQLATSAKNPDVTLQQALDFAKTVESRVEGKMPSPFLQTLLMCRPDFRAAPSEEFSRGFKIRYECDGAGRAKGIRFGIHYPLSWKALEGSRPNIVQKFVSENGRGLEMVMIQVKSLPDDLVSGVKTEKQVAEFFSLETMKGMTPEGAQFIKSEKIKIDGIYGATLEYSMEEQRLTETVKLRSITYLLIFKDSLVSIICQVAAPGSISEVEFETTFRKFLPLFKMMANGFSLNNQWEGTGK